jgi:hypothetical protein
VPPELQTTTIQIPPSAQDFEVRVDPDAPAGNFLPALARLLLDRVRRRLLFNVGATEGVASEQAPVETVVANG